LGVKNVLFFELLERKRPADRNQLPGRNPAIFAFPPLSRGEEIVKPER